MAKAKVKSETWRNRIIETGVKPAKDFLANPQNPRRHPNAQRDVIRDILGEVGWIGAVIENKRTGNLIDGHLRIEEALSANENEPVPYLLVDLSQEEESLILASYDAVGDLAIRDYRAQQELLESLQSDGQALDALLDQMRADAEMGIEATGGASDRRGLTMQKHQVVKTVIAVTQANIIETALAVTGLRNRGDALTEICKEYLSAKGQFDILTEGELKDFAA